MGRDIFPTACEYRGPVHIPSMVSGVCSCTPVANLTFGDEKSGTGVFPIIIITESVFHLLSKRVAIAIEIDRVPVIID